ncbi:MAG: S53 family peptidase [Candidatus Sulfotelmatobacter sp.]
MLNKILTSAVAFSVISVAILTTPAAVAQRIANNVPDGIRQASDLGLIDPASEVNITVQLKMQNEPAFDKQLEALYDPSSPSFHQWLTDKDLKNYAPPKEQFDAVRTELENHGLTILSVDKNGLSIRARGPAGNIESAFNTEIHEFQRDGKLFRANVENARLSGAAGDYVTAVAGIESHEVHPLLRRAVNLRTHEPPPTVALSKVEASGGLGSIVTDQILYTPATFTFTTPGASLPVGVYYGNVYGANPALTPDYTPSQLQALYGLPAAYKQGLDGTGQTIVLLEAFGYPTNKSDANAFFKLAGLPPLTSSTFSIVYPEGKPVDPNAGIVTGWNIEIALDTQWAHSIAPGAKIIVVAAAGQDNEDLLDAMSYIIDNNLGYTINDSWEVDQDISAGPLEEEAFDDVLKLAAAKGISFQFSSGDGGDGGIGTPIGAPLVPSNSPHATGVGGTSILNNINGSGYEALGWGTSFVALNDVAVLDPPLAQPFWGGSGGGESIYFPKPSWQKGLHGTGRHVPDVSALADPWTGVPIVVTVNGVQQVQVGWGGTSLASPIFTAIWATANQKAGHSLGQAAPTIDALPSGDLVDVLPLTSPTNVAGTIFDSTGSTYYSPASLFDGLVGTSTGFTSAVVNFGGGVDNAISFGLDSSLTVTKGWDDVTGYGTPYGLTFLNAVAK